MAKRQRRAAPEVVDNPTIREIFDNLSAGLQRQVTGMRDRFGGYAEAFRAVWQKRDELVDPFFALYRAVQGERDCTFVQFVGVIDPSVPVDHAQDITRDGRLVKGYRAHPSYQAALYMDRLRRQRIIDKKRAADQAAAEAAGLPAPAKAPRALNATDRLARVLASMLQMVRTDQIEAFWSGMGAEMDLDTAALLRLRKATDAADPILRVPENLRQAQRIPVRIIHMVRPGETAAAAGAEQEAQRNVRRRRAA